MYAQILPSYTPNKIETSITVDAKLDEEAWDNAEPISGFLQIRPDEGDQASQKTEARVLYGDGHLYIGAVLFDNNPAEIEQTLGRRDEYNRADWFLVSIDSYFTREYAYVFGVNAAGVQFDAFQTGGDGGEDAAPEGMDTSWDAIWYSDVRVTDQGWVVEMRIPYSMLRFSDAETQTWGIHFSRHIPRLGETSEWPFIAEADRGNLVARFGHLTQINNIEPRPNIQLRPYTVSRLNTRESISEPGQTVVDNSQDIGGDVKIGLGPNITLDATFNPDFGQVESDPAVLNLTAFETFFEEKRPFFVEGSQIYGFAVGPGELLYTRRIGARNPIIGAAKVSGRTSEGLSFGLLGSATGNNLNPSRYYGVGRMSQQIGDYSSAGGILTAMEGPYELGEGRSESFAGGADWDLRFNDNRYGMEGFASFTHRNWTTPDRTAETGFAGKVWMRKRQGVWRGFTGLDVFSDRFNPNDLGQLTENNFIASVNNIQHQINRGRPFGPFQRADLDFFGLQQFSYDGGLNLGQTLELVSIWRFRTFQTAEVGMNIENIFGGYDLYETRGLWPWAEPAEIGFTAEIESDERRSWQGEPEVGLSFQEGGGRTYSMGLLGDWNIGRKVSVSANLEGEWEQDVSAWVANESFRETDAEWMIGTESVSPDQLSEEDYVSFNNSEVLEGILAEVEPYRTDQYYVPVFGRRDTGSLDLTLRSTITFTPFLSLQTYGQLFLARGRFDEFQISQNKDNLAEFAPYPKRSDFTLNSLQSNIVLRWEYRPGSTVFLVWSHGRNERDQMNPLAPQASSPYNRPIGERLGDTFDIFPENAFLVKVNYTFRY